MMGTWLYIAAGIGAFIVFVLMFVLMTLADGFEQVNGDVNHSEGLDGVGDKL